MEAKNYEEDFKAWLNYTKSVIISVHPDQSCYHLSHLFCAICFQTDVNFGKAVMRIQRIHGIASQITEIIVEQQKRRVDKTESSHMTMLALKCCSRNQENQRIDPYSNNSFYVGRKKSKNQLSRYILHTTRQIQSAV